MAVTLPAVRSDGKSFGAAASILKPLMTILWLAESGCDCGKLFSRQRPGGSWTGLRCFGIAEIAVKQIRALIAEFPEQALDLP